MAERLISMVMMDMKLQGLKAKLTFPAQILFRSLVGNPDAHNTGAESNTKPAREKQGALIVAIYLPTKYSQAPSQGGVFSLVIAKKQSWNWSFHRAAFALSRHRSISQISL